MKRSEINRILREAEAFLDRHQFRLPPFASWTPADWRAKGPECREIVERGLGWDITDFGSGDFARVGLFLFTVRNGSLADLQRGEGKTYAEKIMIVREGQLTPTHFHAKKTEDIIVRGGGRLLVRLWNADARDRLDATAPVVVSLDGVRRELAPGATVALAPGESVTLTQRLYHNFEGEQGGGTVLVGEVSTVNDDRTDNFFLEPAGRFPKVEEDEAPLRPLCGDLVSLYRVAKTV